jgi:hypothetical protein
MCNIGSDASDRQKGAAGSDAGDAGYVVPSGAGGRGRRVRDDVGEGRP